MAYTNAIFYMDETLGSDTTRTTLTNCIVSNPSGSITNVFKVGHGVNTGDIVSLTAFSAWLAGDWKVTRVDADNFTLDGAVWQATADADGSIVPFGGGSWADAWKTVTTGATQGKIAPGDIIRIAKSPAPYSIGDGTWTTTALALGGFQGSNQNITSSTNAAPVVVTKNAHGLVNGQIVSVTGHATNTAANGVWKVANKTANTFELEGSTGNGIGGATGQFVVATSGVVQLATAQTKNITRCELVWTAIGGGDATPSADTSAKEGARSARIALDAAPQASVGQAYFTIPSTDFSGYQGISFWLLNNLAIADNATLIIHLCSDTAGATPVDTFVIPAIASSSVWLPLTIMKSGGGNLGAAIQSIAIYTGTTAPANNIAVYLDNIIAVTTSGLNLQSLISTNTLEQGGTEAWYPIQSIDESQKFISLGTVPSLAPTSTSLRGWYGTTTTAATYARETIKLPIPTAVGTTVNAVNDSGTLAGGNIQFQGGYNTSNSAQDGETLLDNLNGKGIAFSFSTRNFITCNHIGGVRSDSGIAVSSGTQNDLDNVFATGCVVGVSLTAPLNDCSNLILSNNGNGFYVISNASNCKVQITQANNCDYGIYYLGNGKNKFFPSFQSYNNTLNSIIFFASQNEFYGCSFGKNGNAGMVAGTNIKNIQYFKDCLFEDSSVVGLMTTLFDTRVYSTNHNLSGYDRVYTDGGLIDSMATDRAGGTGKMWKFAITDATRTSVYPLNLSVAKIAVKANKAVTITAYMKKDHATNVGGQLVVRGGQLAGVASDVTATASTADTNWHLVTLADFTPTEAGVIELECWATYVAGNSNVYIEDLSITQAA